MTSPRTSSWLRAAATLALLAPAVAMAGPDLGAAEKQPLNWHAIGMFFVFVLMTLGITYWAAGRSKSASDFYTAGGGITGKQNGLAIAGDFMSAATLLGLTAMIYGDGVDGYIYMIAFFVGWPIILFLMAERLRNLGKFTFSDITAYRLDQGKVRTMAAISSLTVVCFYLIAQMVGAGQLIKLLFGLDYNIALFVVGALMMVYVTFGGMVATTWVQIIKACMLLAGGTLVMILAMSQFGFSYTTVVEKAVAAHKSGWSMMSPGKLIPDPVTAVSLALGLPCAWILYRTRFPGRGLVRAVVTIPFVLPTVVVGVVLPRVCLVRHPQPLAQPRRRGVARIELRNQPVQRVVVEREVDERPRRLRGESAAGMLPREHPAELGDRRGRAGMAGCGEREHEVADDDAVVLDREREPLAHLRRRGRGEQALHPPRQPVGVERRKRQVAGDLRIGAVAPDRCGVGRDDGTQHQALRAHRERRGRQLRRTLGVHGGDPTRRHRHRDTSRRPAPAACPGTMRTTGAVAMAYDVPSRAGVGRAPCRPAERQAEPSEEGRDPCRLAR